MRNLLIILTAIVVLATANKITAQPLHNDTVVCIIDTTQSYVSYRAYPFAPKDSTTRWQIAIKGHYYDYDSPDFSYSQYKDFACIVFEAGYLRGIYTKTEQTQVSQQVKVAKAGLEKRYVTANEEWINKR